MDVVTLALAKKYTAETAQGMGAVQGKPGPKGPPGDTPYIGENGNWWTGTTDTGVPASGTTDHRKLTNRDAEDQHPIEAISGLEEISNKRVLEIWNGGINK